MTDDSHDLLTEREMVLELQRAARVKELQRAGYSAEDAEFISNLEERLAEGDMGALDSYQALIAVRRASAEPRPGGVS